MNYNNSSFLNQLSSSSLGASMTSGALRIRDAVGLAIYLKWTGAGTDGTFKIQVSNDPQDTLSNFDTPSNWIDLPGSNWVASGAGDNMWSIKDTFFSFVRVVFTRSSGTGTIVNASITTKGYG
jgi:hypothetical protein